MFSKELVAFEEAIWNTSTRSEFNNLAKKVDLDSNPHFGYRLGERFLIGLEDYAEAEAYFLKAIKSGTADSKNLYLDSPFSDSIGQSIFYVLENHTFKNKKLEYDLTCYCYIYLTSSIQFFSNIDQVGYNSYLTRGRLIRELKSKNSSVIAMIKNHY